MTQLLHSSYPLVYKEIDGVSAIWFEYNHREFIADPRVLFDGIIGTDDKSLKSLLYTDVDSMKKGRAYYYAKQEFHGDHFIWIINKILDEPECQMRFEFQEFLTKTEESLKCLYNDIVANKPTAYNGIINLKDVSKISDQLKITRLFLLPGMLRSSQINEEKLLFDCPIIKPGDEYWAYDIQYELGISNRKFSSYISEWSNDIDLIRYQLESYCYCRKAKIKLYNEDNPTIISFQHINTLASVNNIGSGIGYKYDDFMKVVIQPDSLDKGATITGFCNEKESIKELYEGLLNIGRTGYTFDYADNPWKFDSIVFYNHIKSPIIERYLSGIKEKYNSISERQKIIHHVLTISPDYTHVLGQMTGQSEVIEVFSDDIVTLFKTNSEEVLCSVTLPGIYDWLDEFNTLSDGVNSTMSNMDVAEWHHRGLILAKELKKKLPEDFDVWYGYPFEDTEHRNSRPILITDGTLKEYFEEELSKACLRNDRERIDYCLNMDADINANDGSALKSLIASEEPIQSLSKEELNSINIKKMELFEHLCTKGLIINAGKHGIDPVIEQCKRWKCDLIENRINEILEDI